MITPKQKYSIYRDDELLVADVRSLVAINSVARRDARSEHAQGRTAKYRISGSLGFTRHGRHYRGKLRWEGKLKLGIPGENGGVV